MKLKLFDYINVVAGVKTLTLSNIVNAMTGLLLITLLTSKLGLNGFGEFSLLQGGVLIGCAIFNFKIWEPLISSLRKGCIIKKFNTALVLESLVTITGFLITSIVMIIYNIKFLLSDASSLGIIAISTSVIWTSISSQSALVRYYSNYRVMLVASLTSGIFKLFPMLLLDLTLDGICITYALSELSRYLVVTIFLYYKLGFKRVRVSKIFLRSIYSRSLRLNISSVLDIPINYFDRYIVNAFMGAEYVGIYVLARRIGSVFSIFCTSYYQHIYLSVYKKAESNIKTTIEDCLYLILKMNFILVCFLIVTYPLSGLANKFFLIVDEDSILVMFFVIYSCIFSYVSNFIHPVFLYAEGYKFIVMVTLISNFIYMLIVSFMIQKYSLFGAAFSLILQALIMFILKFAWILNFYDKKNKTISI